MRVLMLSILALSALIGCASGDRGEQIIPKSDQTVVEVYDEHVSKSSLMESARESLVRSSVRESGAFDPYLQTNNAKPKYRKLHNPTLYIYFPPSINEAEGIPTPGWMSEVKMYASDQYALPGEAAVGGAK